MIRARRGGLLARWGILLWFSLPFAAVSAPGGLATAQLRDVADPEERLDLWFQEARDDIDFTRFVAGPLSIGAGAVVLGAGAYALADDIYDDQPNLAYLQLGVGILGIAQGVVWLLIHPDPEERFQRFRRAREAGLDDDERHRFEGELRAYRYIAAMQRSLFRWSGLGLLFGGAVVLGILPQADAPTEHEVVGYSTAGIYTAIGATLLIASFIPSFGEDGYREYREGRAPALSRLEIAPLAGPGTGGLQVSGRF
ncbi:MAG: hypothetical protein AAGF12_37725 [Myxococcota bacterium]